MYILNTFRTTFWHLESRLFDKIGEQTANLMQQDNIEVNAGLNHKIKNIFLARRQLYLDRSELNSSEN